MQLSLCLLGRLREMKEPDAPAGVQCSGQAIGAWLLRLMGKGLQMSGRVSVFACSRELSGQLASKLHSYGSQRKRRKHTLSISHCFINDNTVWLSLPVYMSGKKDDGGSACQASFVSCPVGESDKA